MRPFTQSEMVKNLAYIAFHYIPFNRHPSSSRESIRSFQLRKIKKLIEFAYQNVDLYRQTYDSAGIHPRDLQKLEDIAFFPTIQKDDILSFFPDGALAKDLDLDRCLISKSSGSTGQVLNVIHQADKLGIQGLAMNRLFNLYGSYMPWHRMVYVYTSEFPSRGIVGMYPMLWISTLTPIEELISLLIKLRPHFLACYPSHLRAIATEMGPDRCRELGLKAISVSSEPSTQEARDDLSHLFGCGVYDEYSTEELTHVAAQCIHKKYHIFEDIVFLEILSPHSDQSVAHGEQGEVVGTYLHNFAMPFIRYRLGDVASFDAQGCSCGWNFRTISGISGRKLDQFVLPSGQILTSGWLLDASYSFLLDVGADIAAFTMIQEALDKVRIEIVPGKTYSNAMTESIRTRFLELVREPIDVEIQLVPEIIRSGGGKHHPIISHVSH